MAEAYLQIEYTMKIATRMLAGETVTTIANEIQQERNRTAGQ